MELMQFSLEIWQHFSTTFSVCSACSNVEWADKQGLHVHAAQIIIFSMHRHPDNVPGLIPYGIGTGHHGHTGASPGKGNPGSIPYGPRTGLPVVYPYQGQMDLAHQPRLNPVRGPYGHARGFPERTLPSITQMNPVRDLSGHAQLHPMVSQDLPSEVHCRGPTGVPRGNPMELPQCNIPYPGSGKFQRFFMFT